MLMPVMPALAEELQRADPASSVRAIDYPGLRLWAVAQEQVLVADFPHLVICLRPRQEMVFVRSFDPVHGRGYVMDGLHEMEVHARLELGALYAPSY